jgi:CBS domain containing-hemolysin-like protein
MIEYNTEFFEVLELIKESGYSRIPVYKETYDNIAGVLYIKDLLPYLDENQQGFEWQKLIREPFFVPENKKIDDLLREFQQQKIHIAIVVDEYGGMSGIITLEDIIEEIVGDINDEFDEDEVLYSKLDDFNYIFKATTSLKDLCKILKVPDDYFEEVRGESDTLGGLMLELFGRIPRKNERIQYKNLTFTVELADKKRIKRVKITIHSDMLTD